MGQGIIGWRLHIGCIFPTPVPPRAIREFYDVVPDGFDMTTVSLTIQQLSDDNMDEAIAGMERAARQLSNFDVDLIYQSGVPPIVRRDPGFHKELEDRLSQASGLPAMTDMGAVLEAMRACNIQTLAMATPFEQTINHRLVKYLAREGVEIVNDVALGILRNTEIRRLPIPVEYQTARKAFLDATRKPEGLYVPCGGWGSVRNVPLLERDLDTTVITWFNGMIWGPMRQMRLSERIEGCGRLLEMAGMPPAPPAGQWNSEKGRA
jgi:maleate isomerase